MTRTYIFLTVGLLLVVGCARAAMQPYWAGKQAAEVRPESRAPKPAVALPAPPRVEKEGVLLAAVQPVSPVVDPAQTGRVMIYKAVISLVVGDIRATVEAIQDEAEKAGGYMQAMAATSITVKVPAGELQDVIAAVEKLGDVTQKDITGSDVTEQMRDLRIRLDNAEEVRKRLVALLERADKVEDALKVERELERVTETIELLKGKIRALGNQVDYSTLTVHLNSPLPQRIIKEEVPFPWVRVLAGDMVKGRVTEDRLSTRGQRVAFELPESFAKYHEAYYITRATSADGVLIKVQRHLNVEGADLAFWTTLIRRSLTANQAIAINQVRDTTIRDKVEARIIEGSKEIAGEKYAYLVAVAQTRDYVYTYEAWGLSENVAKAKESLEKSIRSMDVLTFFQSLFR